MGVFHNNEIETVVEVQTWFSRTVVVRFIQSRPKLNIFNECSPVYSFNMHLY
jgi:hypothetical protein